MRVKAAGWALIALVGTAITLTIVAAAASRTEPLRKLVVATLSERLNSDVDLQSFSVDTFPRVVIRGEGLVLRLRATPTTGDIPPLIQIKSFTVHCGVMDLIRRPRRFKRVVLDGLVVNIPPGGLKSHDNPIGEAVKATSSDSRRLNPGEAPIVIDELSTEGAMLRIIPKKAGKQPREFAIRSLVMQFLGFAEAMPYRASVTNPLPKGQVEANGTFGPWKKDDPSTTPLSGNYTFDNADLDTIDGLGGILSSRGTFNGELERIVVKGETHTPDFSLDISRQPVPLDTKFEALVDGTDGDTYLNNVDATFLKTSLTARGAVVGTKGVKGRTIKLHVRVHQGRIEDLLRLSTKAKTPLMVGGVALHADFTLPPGKRDVFERLELAGEFDVQDARFTNPDVQKKLTGMSRRARGLTPDAAPADKVVSDLEGRFRLHNGTVSFSSLAFSMPGATVALIGSYGLRSEALSFDGTLRMEATVSQAAGGGLKSFFLKIVDPLFRKKGAGALIPIRIRGTVDDPKFGLDVGRVFKH
jgi:AsmA-like C-terminal region